MRIQLFQGQCLKRASKCEHNTTVSRAETDSPEPVDAIRCAEHIVFAVPRPFPDHPEPSETGAVSDLCSKGHDDQGGDSEGGAALEEAPSLSRVLSHTFPGYVPGGANGTVRRNISRSSTVATDMDDSWPLEGNLAWESQQLQGGASQEGMQDLDIRRIESAASVASSVNTDVGLASSLPRTLEGSMRLKASEDSADLRSLSLTRWRVAMQHCMLSQQAAELSDESFRTTASWDSDIPAKPSSAPGIVGDAQSSDHNRDIWLISAQIEQLMLETERSMTQSPQTLPEGAVEAHKAGVDSGHLMKTL